MTNLATRCSSQVPVLHASQVDFGKLKGKGSFCNVVEVNSFPLLSSIQTPSSGNNSNVNASWDFKIKKASLKYKNSLQRKISSENIGGKGVSVTKSKCFSNSNFSKLSLRVSDSSLKLRNLILNTSKHSNSTNRFRSSGEKQT